MFYAIIKKILHHNKEGRNTEAHSLHLKEENQMKAS